MRALVATDTQCGAGIGSRGQVMLVTGVDRESRGLGRIGGERADTEVMPQRTIISLLFIAGGDTVLLPSLSTQRFRGDLLGQNSY